MGKEGPEREHELARVSSTVNKGELLGGEGKQAKEPS